MKNLNRRIICITVIDPLRPGIAEAPCPGYISILTRTVIRTSSSRMISRGFCSHTAVTCNIMVNTSKLEQTLTYLLAQSFGLAYTIVGGTCMDTSWSLLTHQYERCLQQLQYMCSVNTPNLSSVFNMIDTSVQIFTAVSSVYDQPSCIESCLLLFRSQLYPCLATIHKRPSSSTLMLSGCWCVSRNAPSINQSM